MLSQSLQQGKLNEKKRVSKLPELNPPMPVRLKFIKVGTLQYISHLDLQRTFNRIINRACLPVWYTQGFNPHIKLVFSTPLSVGTESVCEYLDIRIDRKMSLEQIKDRLNYEMTDEFHVVDVYEPKSDFSEIKWASYKMCIVTSGADAQLARGIEQTLASPMYLTKKTKAGETEIDIVSLINSVNVRYNEENKAIEIDTIVSASTTDYLNPEMIIKGLKSKLGILSGDPTQEYYTILRTELYKKDMTVFS